MKRNFRFSICSKSLPLIVALLFLMSLTLTLSKFASIEEPKQRNVEFGESAERFPSDTFINCYFNPLCYCKYDQKTQVFDSISRLWQLVGFNGSEFTRVVGQALDLMTSDTTSLYFLSRSEILAFAHLVANSSSGSRQILFEPGPVFDIECTDVPMALIPTEYSAHGVLSQVSVTGSKLTMLDGSAFAGLDVQGIRLSRNELYYISEYAFSSMSSSLGMLDLSSNSLDEVPFTPFKTLKLLEWLNLSNNLLISLSGDWFSVSESLRKLLVSSNSIDSLPHDLLRSFKRLSWLDLSHNFIKNLSTGSLPANVETLNLMRNRLTHIPPAVFHLESLTWLFLSGCAIETVPDDWTAPIPMQMNQLDLSENFIQVWPKRAFAGQLIVLDLGLARNYLVTLPAAAFDSMSVFRLSLGFNRIKSLDPLTFQSLDSSLKYLNLENNQLDRIPWEALHNLSSLMHLYVGSNLLQDEGLATSMLIEGPECKLTHLGLNGNQLSRLPRRLLAQCPHLIHINLGYNQITHLDDLVHFRGRKLHSLSTLILRNNPIRTISYVGHAGHGQGGHGSSGHGSPKEGTKEGKLEEDWGNTHLSPWLDPGTKLTSGSDNEIKEPGTVSPPPSLSSSSGPASLPNVFRIEVVPNLRELSLSFCQLAGELEAWPSLPLTTLEISMGLKSATSLHPALFHSLKNLEWLALDHNSLQSISDYTFYSNRKLTYVNLEWNRLTTLPPLLFHPQLHPAITTLRLSHNKIKTLSSETFYSFPGISLDLSYNQIKSIESWAFMSSLRDSGSSIKTGHASTEIGTGVIASNTSHPSYSPLLNIPSTIGGNSGGILDENPGLTVHLSRNKISRLGANAFGLNKFSLIDLSWNKISTFNFDALSPSTIVASLNLSANGIENIARPRGDEKRFLKVLDLKNNKIQSKSLDLTFICVTDLIDLSYNRLDAIDKFHFPANCSLKELNLEGNSISTLDPSSFTTLRDLTVLRLGKNQLNRLPTITFIRNPKLKFLDLSHNKLRTIPRDGLVGSAIEILNLASNQFVTIPVGALSQVARRLKRLDLSCNWIEHLDSTMFEFIPALVSLNLSTNRLSSLPDSAFANLASLRELDLSYNFLRANFKELFHFLPKLKVLGLAGCGIKVLPFLPLPHLVSLDLSANGLQEMKMQSLSSLTRLRRLDLSANELVGPRLPSWTPLYNLIQLKLNQNPIRSFTRDTLYGLGRLERLEIVDMGRIDRFDSDVFSHLHNLRSLAVETHPNIEKYRFRLGQVLSSIPHLEELTVKIKESTLSDQLLGGILPKLRKLVIHGGELRKIESSALEGLQNCFHMDLAITQTGIEEIPPRIFDLLQFQAWARLDLSFNKMSSLDSAALYPNKTIWFSKGTKILEGGLILEGNEFICDCDLVWIGEWLRRWLRESFQSHSTESVALVHGMYETIRRPKCTDSKGRLIPLIELYSDVMCHASALSGGGSTTTVILTNTHILPLNRSAQILVLIILALAIG